MSVAPVAVTRQDQARPGQTKKETKLIFMILGRAGPGAAGWQQTTHIYYYHDLLRTFFIRRPNISYTSNIYIYF